MGWVRVSDDFYDHDRFAEVGPLGLAVWITGLAYCNRNLTDGRIPKRAALRLMHIEGIGVYEGNYAGRDAQVEDGIAELVGAGQPIDDVAIDRRLAGDRVPLTTAEKAEARRRWLAAGRPLAELEGVTGINSHRRYEEAS